MEKEISFKDELSRQGLEIPYSTDTDHLAAPLCLYGRKIPNRIGIQPLEGYDSGTDGGPPGGKISCQAAPFIHDHGEQRCRNIVLPSAVI